MKILIIKDLPGEIRAHRMTYNVQELGLAVALRKMGHECDVMSISDTNRFSQDSISLNGQNIKLYSVKAIVALKNGWLKCVDEIFGRYDILHVCECCFNSIFRK